MKKEFLLVLLLLAIVESGQKLSDESRAGLMFCLVLLPLRSLHLDIQLKSCVRVRSGVSFWCLTWEEWLRLVQAY